MTQEGPTSQLRGADVSRDLKSNCPLFPFAPLYKGVVPTSPDSWNRSPHSNLNNKYKKKLFFIYNCHHQLTKFKNTSSVIRYTISDRHKLYYIGIKKNNHWKCFGISIQILNLKVGAPRPFYTEGFPKRSINSTDWPYWWSSYINSKIHI